MNAVANNCATVLKHATARKCRFLPLEVISRQDFRSRFPEIYFDDSQSTLHNVPFIELNDSISAETVMDLGVIDGKEEDEEEEKDEEEGDKEEEDYRTASALGETFLSFSSLNSSSSKKRSNPADDDAAGDEAEDAGKKDREDDRKNEEGEKIEEDKEIESRREEVSIQVDEEEEEDYNPFVSVGLGSGDFVRFGSSSSRPNYLEGEESERGEGVPRDQSSTSQGALLKVESNGTLKTNGKYDNSKKSKVMNNHKGNKADKAKNSKRLSGPSSSSKKRPFSNI
jgi:hypothetical protein